MVPYEQNTQQSPVFGASIALQAGHSKKNWQASVGIVSSLWYPQAGHLSTLWS